MEPTTADEFIPALQQWCEKQALRLCVLFGSQATGHTHSTSDIDLAVWPHQPFLATRKLKWLTELETKLSRDVSLVVVTPELNPVLGFEIIQNGRLIYEEKEGMWADERARLWHLHNDSLPFRRALRRQLREFAQEVHRGA